MADGTLKVGTITTSSGSGTITLGQSGETISIPSGATVSGAGANTPAFSAYLSADQTGLADNTFVKVAMDTEFYDSDGKYDTSNYRFTPTVAGKYIFGASLYIEGSNTLDTSQLALYKNGSKILYKEENLDNITCQQITGSLVLDDDDYVELYIKVDVASGGTFFVNQDGTTTNNRAYWYGYRVIGA
jgi:hypothetical protein